MHGQIQSTCINTRKLCKQKKHCFLVNCKKNYICISHSWMISYATGLLMSLDRRTSLKYQTNKPLIICLSLARLNRWNHYNNSMEKAACTTLHSTQTVWQSSSTPMLICLLLYPISGSSLNAQQNMCLDAVARVMLGLFEASLADTLEGDS